MVLEKVGMNLAPFGPTGPTPHHDLSTGWWAWTSLQARGNRGIVEPFSYDHGPLPLTGVAANIVPRHCSTFPRWTSSWLSLFIFISLSWLFLVLIAYIDWNISRFYIINISAFPPHCSQPLHIHVLSLLCKTTTHSRCLQDLPFNNSYRILIRSKKFDSNCIASFLHFLTILSPHSMQLFLGKDQITLS
jgi:hypothetical protein